MRYKNTFTASGVLLAALSGITASPHVSAKPYKGGEISTLTPELYGRYTMRMRMAKGSGILSTFFTYKEGSEQGGVFWEEIDIEVLGKDNATILQTNVIVGDPRITTEGFHNFQNSLADDYHTYTLEWTDKKIAWLVDGVLIRQINGNSAFIDALQNSQDMRFNLWAASIPEWVGNFDTGALPTYQYINWFTYESYDPNTGSFSLEWRDDFNSYDESRWKSASHTFDVNLVDFIPENVLVKEGTLILALTHENATGHRGTVPADTPNPTPTQTPTPTPTQTPAPTPTPTPTQTPTPTPTPNETVDCRNINIYPNWVRKDWPGGSNTHNNTGDLMQFEGAVYSANWYTNTRPGSDGSWTYMGEC